jgi:hypothetical protein
LVNSYFQNPAEFKKQLEIEKEKNKPEVKTEIKEIIKEVPAPEKSL